MAQKEVQIGIGGRTFDVACQDGEEQYLFHAANLLDQEAQVLVGQIGRMPEARMLLMAGLMLADKTAGLEEQLKDYDDRLSSLQAELAELKAREPREVEVPRIPEAVNEAMAELAARAETIADSIEELKAG